MDEKNKRMKRNLENPFVAAVLGGLLVGAFALIAIATGLVKSDSNGTVTVSQAPVAEPAVSKSTGGQTIGEIYKHDAPGVVFIRSQGVQAQSQSPFGPPEGGSGTATGSGFVIDKGGYILTNAHVVEGAKSISVGFEDGKTAKAERVGEDVSSDIALLKVDVDQNLLQPLSLGDSSSTKVGDPVIAIGNPFGLDRTATTGIVSALQREIDAPNGFTITNVIQTDAAINPGNSGGPLLDAAGRVIGINSQIETGGGGNGNVGVGFAVPINTAKKALGDLKTKGNVQRAYLGITGLTLDSSLTGNLNLPTDRGALVQDVVKGGPADDAGVKGGSTQASVGGVDLLLGGDIITEVDGKRINSMDEVVAVVNDKKPGQDVELTVYRGKKQQTISVKLGTRPKSAQQ